MVWSSVVKVWAYSNQVECRAGYNMAVGEMTRSVVTNACNWCLGSRKRLGDGVGGPQGVGQEVGLVFDDVALGARVENGGDGPHGCSISGDVVVWGLWWWFAFGR